MSDIVHVLDEHRVVWQAAGHRHVRSGWIGVDCPFCSPGSHKWKCGFEIGTGRVNCWTCGILDGPAVLSKICRLPMRTAIAIWLGIGHAHRPIPQTLQSKGRLQIPKGVEPMQLAHRQYLEKRGFDPDEIEALWGVRGIGLSTHLKWRLFIPIQERGGSVVSWTTRSLSDSAGLRYISASEAEEDVPHKHVVYGSHLARSAIIVVEGPIDAWAIGPGAGSLLGVSYTEQQVRLIGEFPTRVICFDAEPAAQRRAETLCENLSLLPGRTENVVLETGSDPASADKNEIYELRETFLKNSVGFFS